MNTESQTPRTDALITRLANESVSQAVHISYVANLARTLEREAATLRAALKEVCDGVVDEGGDYAAVTHVAIATARGAAP